MPQEEEEVDLTTGDDEGDAQQTQMDRDIAERDAMIQRMRERDEKKTQKQIEEKEKKNAAPIIDMSDRNTVDLLREASRQDYLQKREKQQLEILEASIQDEEMMFSGQNLTKSEKKKLEINKRILNLATQKRSAKDAHEEQTYVIPGGDNYIVGQSIEQKREKALTARYHQDTDGGAPKSEQQLWEEEQAKKSREYAGKKQIGSGQQQVKTAHELEQEQYDLIQESSIEFVSLELLEGKKTLEQVKLQAEQAKQDEIDSIAAKKEAAKNAKKELTPHEKILEGRKKLPVYSYRDEFLEAVANNKVLIVEGQTGSGKTTQIPQYLHEGGWSKKGKIGCTQPRRVAAMSVASRVAEEMNVKLGQEVGYSIRFEDCTSQSTIIKYMTDGMLLREFLNEPDLGGYSCMIIDEAHERTLHTDVLFGLVKDISRFRGDDFRLIIASATLDADKFRAYFDDAPKFTIPGRMFNVDKFYTKQPEADYVDACVVTVLQVHVTQELDGDILVFLTGQEEIETVAEILTLRAKSLGSKIAELIICPIYSSLPSDQQAKIFEKTPKGARKVVLGTNIAETSLTIDGICYVIDPGFAKQKSYNPKTGMESLIVTPISRAASEQRAGRAGRTQPGKCFRLYTAWSFENELEPNAIPEIQRTNMSNVVLMLKSLGIDDLLNFDFMDKPPVESLLRALENLYALGALNDRGELTKMGRRMAEFPLDPMMSKSLIVSEKYQCTSEILTIVSMLSIGGTVFHRPKEKAIHADTAKQNFARGGGGDHIALMRVYNEWVATGYSTQWCYENYLQVRSLNRARDVREQLLGLCERVELEEVSCQDINTICKALCAGYFFNAAKITKTGDYQTVKQRHTTHIHPSSVLARDPEPPKWLLYHELAFTTKEYMRTVAPMDGAWLTEIAPHYYQKEDIEDKGRKMPSNKAQGKSSVSA